MVWALQGPQGPISDLQDDSQLSGMLQSLSRLRNVDVAWVSVLSASFFATMGWKYVGFF